MRLTRTNSLLVLVAIMAICLSGANVMAQRGGGRPGGGGGGGFGGFGGGSSLLDVAARKEVQEHLELLPDQIDDLTKLAEAQRAGQRDRFRGLDFGALRDGSEEERAAARAKIQEAFRKAAADTQVKVDNILLPHQSKRLGQLAMQRRLRGGITAALGSEEMSTQLGISADQREQLRDKAREADAVFRAKVAKLREEMQADLLKDLSPSQQAKYESLVGKPFEFAADERGPGGRGGRTGGGRPGGGQERGGRTRPQRPGQ
ncbi:MAG: hypothetical protein QGH33_16185 [Pirellulaceae bacterium]|nr:hypothetical protein [Pirellulaceae bacterium]MDP7305533.1 hypothetical protein [Pirellulaceae bacterium]HJN11432.1 hypothetical protein [Pirellulaceae bacterium]